MVREVKRLLVKAESVTIGADGVGEISGYANVKGVVDSYGDRVIDGAYKGLDALVKKGWFCVSHDWNELPIGTIPEAKEDTKGLFFKASFHSTDDAQDVRKVCVERLERGAEVAFSIGYFPKKFSYETQGDNQVRVLEEIEVFEISVVTMPANDESLATDAKSAPGSRLVDQIAKTVDLAEDILKRCGEIDELRPKGLSAERRGQVLDLSKKLAEIAEKTAETPDDQATPPPADELIDVTGMALQFIHDQEQLTI